MTHDASITVVQDGQILFAGQAERYSQIKHDPDLCSALIEEALGHGEPDVIAFYENRLLKKIRQACDWHFVQALDWSRLATPYLRKWGLRAPVKSYKHHYSHACAGYFTSLFREAAVVVIDAIGEWHTMTIWHAVDNHLKLIKAVNYPSSLGLLYSCFTKRCGLRTNDEEFILMGMAAFGEPIYADRIENDFIGDDLFSLTRYCSKGIGNYLPGARIEDLAASIQKVTEKCVLKIVEYSKLVTKSENLVYMGGVALNCVANTKLTQAYQNVWIMPNPGDAGSSLGCAAAHYGSHLNWTTPYLGTRIEGDYPVEKACRLLAAGKVVGIAKGRAEFGPRALGNRSLFADPRSRDMKDKVNVTKQRQKFRPFAPVIRQDMAQDYFEMPLPSTPYMQYACRAKYPAEFPAVCHVDGTSRVQTVSENEHPGLYRMLGDYYDKTGCPMLLNTSLNVRGKPIVNDRTCVWNLKNTTVFRFCK